MQFKESERNKYLKQNKGIKDNKKVETTVIKGVARNQKQKNNNNNNIKMPCNSQLNTWLIVHFLECIRQHTILNVFIICALHQAMF